MKVEQGKPEFTPITITLETQDEVDMLVSLLGNIGGTNIVRTKLTTPLYFKLEPFGNAVKYKEQVRDLISFTAKS